MFLRLPLLACLAASLLFGVSPASSEPSIDYGRELPIVADLGVGPTMYAAMSGRWLYAIGEGNLYIADASDPAHPKVVGRIGSLGSTRQIVVSRDVAYVSSREDGLFVIDVKSPSEPKLLCHYDSIEWATGLAISGDVLFIACRNFGVELVDVSKPEKPVHLSTVRTGEAQSVVVRNGWLYTGVWGTSEIVVADVRNPREPKITCRVPMDGYGDGVDVRGNFLYAVTGHHSREKHKQQSDPGYGRGHGLEIFDIIDPSKPVFVSRLKFPKFYGLGNDMWGVWISGNNAFVADTYNGVFVVDVTNPREPRCIARHQLPMSLKHKLPAFVGGLMVGDGVIYAAGGWTDLHVLAAPDLARRPVPEPSAPPVIPPLEIKTEDGHRTYRTSGQIYAAAMLKDIAVLACGSEGIQTVRLWPETKLLKTYPAKDFVTDVYVLGDLVFVAEGRGGLSVWSAMGAAELKLLGRYVVEKQRVRHVAVPAPGKYALVQVGGAMLQIVDVSNPSEPRLALKETRLGLLYGNQIMNGLIDNRYAAAFWHVTGLYWYDLYGAPKPVSLGQKHTDRFSAQDGVVAVDGRLLAIRRGGYVIADRDDSRPFDELPLYRVGKHSIAGKPTVSKKRLYTSERSSGVISIVDIQDLLRPKLVETFTIDGNPGRVVTHGASFIIPNGYNGLLIYDRTR